MVGCSTCGRELTYIAQYDRHYCYSCRAYAPKEIRPCPQCGRALVYVPQYQRYYCYGCQEYKQVAPVAAQPAQASNPCPTCGRELSFIQQYNRYYCYSCKAYAPVKREMSAGAASAAAAAAPAVAGPSAPRPAGGATAATAPSPTPVSSPGAPQAQAAPRAEAGVSPGRVVPFTRQDLDGASKDQLMRWCQDYGLDASGMKYELRLRIMEYMRSQGLDFRDGAGPPTAAEARPGASAAETATPAGPEIVIEAIEEGEEEAAPEAGAATPQAGSRPEVPVAPQPAGGPGAPPRGEGPAAQPSLPAAQGLPAAAATAQAGQARTELAQRLACPTCGGPLSYIAQYDRHYCYRCRAYAPRQVTAAAAHPTVAPLQAYPGYATPQGPGYAPAASPAPRAAAYPAAAPTLPQRAGGNIMVGVYLMLLGLALYGLYEFLVNFPPDLDFGPAVLPPAVGFALRFLGLFFIVVGGALGLVLIHQRLGAKV